MKTLPTLAIILSVVAIAAVWASTVEEFGPAPPTSTRLVTVTNFPDPQNVAGTVNVGNLPAVQQVEVVNFPPPAGAARFQLVGFTAAALSATSGVLGFTGACQAEFPESRMCTLQDILATVALPDLAIGTASAWIDPGERAGPECEGWTRSSSGDFGLTLNKNGGYRREACDLVISVACCAPVE
jgi:hypothetical protein